MTSIKLGLQSISQMSNIGRHAPVAGVQAPGHDVPDHAQGPGERPHPQNPVELAGKTRHSCRHIFVSQLQAQGVPMETIQSLAGHAEMDMTEHYLHIQDSVKATACCP